MPTNSISTAGAFPLSECIFENFSQQSRYLSKKDDNDKEKEFGCSFGFSWFIPELLKHKSIWRDILTASLAIQLVGLATPLFTQVIIYKVVVHQTHSTLIVLGVALIMFMLFTSGMTWLRQYLVRGCAEFCVNGLLAGNCRIVRSHNERKET